MLPVHGWPCNRWTVSCYIHNIGRETEQQNIPIRIRCSQWRVRDTTMWLSRTSAASSTITAIRITDHTNRDQVFLVVSYRHDNVALHRTSQWQCSSPQDLTMTMWLSTGPNNDNVSLHRTSQWQCDSPQDPTMTMWLSIGPNNDNVALHRSSQWQCGSPEDPTMIMWLSTGPHNDNVALNRTTHWPSGRAQDPKMRMWLSTGPHTDNVALHRT
jgi:hypothetical protein